MHLVTFFAHFAERAGAAQIMQQMAVDMQQVDALAYAADDVLIPNLVK